MKIIFQCRGTGCMEPAEWECTVIPLDLSGPYEAEVSSGGNTFHVIIGAHKYGHYICIPNWNIGTELASLTDRFWNHERLKNYTDLSDADACTIADALVGINNLIK